jgi:hypothetical protein
MGELADIYGIDPLKEIKENLKDFTKTENGKVVGEAMIKKISDALKINIDKVRESLNGETLTKQKEVKEKQQENKKDSPITRQELTILIKNDGAMLDAITREIAKDPSFAKSIKELIEKNGVNNNNVKTN